MTVQDFPALNAGLNTLTTLLLAAGYVFVKRGNTSAHRACMVSAIASSAVFLGCYLVYHAQVPPRSFAVQGWPRWVYFPILLSHTILAMVILPLVFFAVLHAVKERFEKHKRITRILWPMWMYVSITGVLVYFMLYHWFA